MYTIIKVMSCLTRTHKARSRVTVPHLGQTHTENWKNQHKKRNVVLRMSFIDCHNDSSHRSSFSLNSSPFPYTNGRTILTHLHRPKSREFTRCSPLLRAEYNPRCTGTPSPGPPPVPRSDFQSRFGSPGSLVPHKDRRLQSFP